MNSTTLNPYDRPETPFPAESKRPPTFMVVPKRVKPAIPTPEEITRKLNWKPVETRYEIGL